MTKKEKLNSGKDMKISAYILILLGIIGVGYNTYKIYDSYVSKGNFSSYVISAVIFGIILIFGILSMSTAKRAIQTANRELSLQDQIFAWLKDNANKDAIDSTLQFTNESEEEKYIIRNVTLVALVKKNFPEITESHIDEIADQMYEVVFGESFEE